MRTAQAHLRKGVGSAILDHVIAVARRRGYRRLSLETGSSDDFAASRALYTRYGFRACEPFADYRKDPFSYFMTLELEPG
jgi:putative acetyltransferase